MREGLKMKRKRIRGGMKIAYPNTLSPSPIGKGGSHGDFLVTLCNGYLARTFFVSAHMRVDIRPFFFV
jgi:hypothetical protein